MGKGQAVLVLDLGSTSTLSLTAAPWGKTDRTPSPRWAVGELGGRWWERRGSGEEGSVRARQTPAKHYFQNIQAGRIFSGTMYFPIVTALSDGAGVADPKPCWGTCFLIRKRI